MPLLKTVGQIPFSICPFLLPEFSVRSTWETEVHKRIIIQGGERNRHMTTLVLMTNLIDRGNFVNFTLQNAGK
jgi:hypothetical protein